MENILLDLCFKVGGAGTSAGAADTSVCATRVAHALLRNSLRADSENRVTLGWQPAHKLLQDSHKRESYAALR